MWKRMKSPRTVHLSSLKGLTQNSKWQVPLLESLMSLVFSGAWARVFLTFMRWFECTTRIESHWFKKSVKWKEENEDGRKEGSEQSPESWLQCQNSCREKNVSWRVPEGTEKQQEAEIHSSWENWKWQLCTWELEHQHLEIQEWARMGIWGEQRCSHWYKLCEP